MRRIFQTTAAFSALLLASACSNSTEVTSLQLSPLSAKQTDQFLNTLGDIGMALSVASVAKPGGFAAACPPGSTACDTTTQDQDADEMASLLLTSIQIGDCDVPRPLPSDLNLPTLRNGMILRTKLQEVDFRIQGDQCPIRLEFHSKASGDPLNGQVTYSLVYEVRDPKMRDIGKISRATLTGTGSFTVPSQELV
ncbi:hypothetical protein K2X33_10670, partial [bacterium]|nr:hypothetical protein [bacterium]